MTEPVNCEEFPRLRELAFRLIEPGEKAARVSASECHEISEGLLALIEEVKYLRARHEDYARAHTW